MDPLNLISELEKGHEPESPLSLVNGQTASTEGDGTLTSNETGNVHCKFLNQRC